MRRAARSCSSSSNGYASSAELSLGLSLGPSDANEEEQDEPEDVHLEEDLLRGIRSLVKKEQFLAQLEQSCQRADDEEGDGQVEENHSDCDDGQLLIPSRHQQLKTHKVDGSTPVSLRRSRATRKSEGDADHFHAIFIEINPVTLRHMQHLNLSSQGIHAQQLRVLANNLFLMSTLKTVNLSNNQLDDSAHKEIRTLISCSGLHGINLSRNLLGRTSIRVISISLRHQIKLRWLDLHGNFFFAYEEDATELAHDMAQAIAINESLEHIGISLPDENTSQPFLSRTPQNQPIQISSKAKKVSSDTILSPAQAFARELVDSMNKKHQHRRLRSVTVAFSELSRRTIVYLMKNVNQLVRLDLTFALMGIPGALVIAAALRMKQYASLTDVNLTGNRMKDMGAKAIIAALQTNNCVTSINLSHNDIRNEFVGDLAHTLMQNHVLTRVELSDNPIFVDTSRQTSMPSCSAATLVKAILQHQWVIDLGTLSSFCAIFHDEQLLASALDKNRLLVDNLLLSTAYDAANAELNDSSNSTKWGGPSIMTLLEPVAVPLFVKVWEHTMRKEARLSLLWRLVLKPAVTKSGGQSHNPVEYTVHWQIMIIRKCDIHGMLEDEAAGGVVIAHSGGTCTVCSAVVYCDEGDVLSLRLYNEMDPNDRFQSSIKSFVKDMLVIPHQIESRHAAFHRIYRSNELLFWKRIQIRNILTDPLPFNAVLERIYIHTSGVYRILWRVQYTSFGKCLTHEDLQRHYEWRIRKGFGSRTEHHRLVLIGRYDAMHAVVRNNNEVVFYLPPMDCAAGEYVTIAPSTDNPETHLSVVRCAALHEVEKWDAATVVCLPFA